MNATPSSERLHIGFFGRSNVGKSSLMNAVTGQEMSVVAEARGTTTDPVPKSMDLLPLGPVVLLDTPGLDDDTALGALRVRRARQMLNRMDIAVMVLDGTDGLTAADQTIMEQIRAKGIPMVVAVNKSDLARPSLSIEGAAVLHVSARTGEGIHELKEAMAKAVPPQDNSRPIVGDLIEPGDVVVLVTPIDAAAPKGRLILPQVQTLRDVLDRGAIGMVTKETELTQTLAKLAAPPKLVVTDSQVFGKVAQLISPEQLMTSFSILFSRYKGFLDGAVRGIAALDRLKDGDTILISEGCTHHRQCGDIGTEKLPRLIRRHCGKDVRFEFSSGTGFPEELGAYALIVHCGGCMLTESAVRARMERAVAQEVPFTNYGVAIALMTGALERSLRLFPALHRKLTEEPG
jgi:[FeFe] hydrogenase H-cluster maturation GTPase HydF